MPSTPRLNLARAATAALATLTLGGALISCSSTTEDPPPAAPVDSAHGAIAPSTAAGAPLDPAEYPADAADAAAITTLIDQYFTTTNAQDADGFRAILCAAAQPEFADIENAGPVSDPMQLEELADIAVDADTATANLTLTMGQSANSPSETVPFKFTRENGEWKVCGSP
ncbi:Rv0361 family membrane protein [Tomitella biformata]|uniref:Rv0361 family membrane protein n=1 Tax=Tomitella biformata TaxID=630403 RepID=UPI000466E1E3|nr:hypothetical protein [Tomitella biformata]